MYLARRRVKGVIHYLLRHSYRENGVWLSRDLVELGPEPGRHIHYPGGHAFWVDAAVEEQLRARGLDFDAEALETLLLPFVRRDIRERYERFTRHRPTTPPFATADEERVACEVHRFDRRRLHYLRYGALDQSRLYRMPARMCRLLLDKSRDEIEQLFMTEEEVLAPTEWKEYVYAILDLARYFDETAARIVPSALPEARLDELVVTELCRLQQDAAFWAGMASAANALDPYLVRYLIMYFDSDWPRRQPWDDTLRRFIDDHRRPQSPPSQRLRMEEAARLFGVDWAALKRLNRRQLTKLYRQRAHLLHPDKGGEAADFATLTAMYRHLRRHLR